MVRNIVRHFVRLALNCSRLCHHIPLPLQTYQDICMTKLSSLSALPLLHYRESRGRPKSELQRLWIVIVSLLLYCSLPVALGDSCSTLAILPHRSGSFLVASGHSSSLLSSSSSLPSSLLLLLLHVLVLLVDAISRLVYESPQQKLG